MNTGHHPILSLFRYIRNYQKLFTWSCINSILNKILDLMPPLLVGWVIDSVRRQPPEWIANTVGTSAPWALAIFLAVLAHCMTTESSYVFKLLHCNPYLMTLDLVHYSLDHQQLLLFV